MDPAFIIMAAMTIVSAVAAMTLRNLVHCALCLAVTFASLAGIYLKLGAQFVGLAQLLVYVGAVAILIVFAILLTGGGGRQDEPEPVAAAWPGILTAMAAGSVLVMAILHSAISLRATPNLPASPIQKVGEKLMSDYVLPLEVAGLLLTAALIGAVVIASQDKLEKPAAPRE